MSEIELTSIEPLTVVCDNCDNRIGFYAEIIYQKIRINNGEVTDAWFYCENCHKKKIDGEV